MTVKSGGLVDESLGICGSFGDEGVKNAATGVPFDDEGVKKCSYNNAIWREEVIKCSYRSAI